MAQGQSTKTNPTGGRLKYRRVGIPTEIEYRLKAMSDVTKKPVAAIIREALLAHTTKFFVKENL